jgi:hypothetical protein
MLIVTQPIGIYKLVVVFLQQSPKLCRITKSLKEKQGW